MVLNIWFVTSLYIECYNTLKIIWKFTSEKEQLLPLHSTRFQEIHLCEFMQAKN